MKTVDPSDFLQGTVLVLVPHMDDEALACGATLAGLDDKSRVYIVYATSGRGSEDLGMPGARVDPGLNMGSIRRQESLAALRAMGLSEENARFLSLPDYRVVVHQGELEERLEELVRELKPDSVLFPFRYDRHTDHVALNHAARAVLDRTGSSAERCEYFVYYRWKMLPRGDVRSYIRPELLASVETGERGETKRKALQCFVSQVTRYFDWQTRPVLSAELIDEVCREPEVFLRAPADAEDASLFTLPLWLIRLVHGIEPVVKRWKDRWVHRIASR